MRPFVRCLFLLLLSYSSFAQAPSISGLWVVQQVEVGSESMTPIARWVRFNEDGTQSSGNGWQQHSVGTWTLKDGDQLSILNTNGYRDDAGPFTITLQDDQMTWSRTEEGQAVKVLLIKTTTLPVAPANQLLGVWKLEQAEVDGVDQTQAYSPEGKHYLFVRWDQQINSQFGPEGRRMGTYRVHGHRNQLFIFYPGDSSQPEQWNFSVDDVRLQLTRQIGKEKLVKTYQRIDYFPE